MTDIPFPVETMPARRWQARLADAEPWLALICAALLLLTSGPVAVVAAIVGAVPLAIRAVRTGWPWRPTVLDVPLGLLLLSALPGAWAALDTTSATARLNGLLAGLYLFAAAVRHAGRPVAGRGIVWGALAGAVLAGLLLAAASDPFLRSQRVPLLAGIMQLLDPEHALGALSVGERLGQWYRLRASGVGAVAGIGLVLVGMLLTAARGAGSWWRRPVAIVVVVKVRVVVEIIVVIVVSWAVVAGVALRVWLERQRPGPHD
jgi:hypothetical protein